MDEIRKNVFTPVIRGPYRGGTVFRHLPNPGGAANWRVGAASRDRTVPSPAFGRGGLLDGLTNEHRQVDSTPAPARRSPA